MKILLAIYVSARGEHSISRRLTSAFMEKWKDRHPDSTVVVRDLAETPPPLVDLPWIGGAFAPPELHSPEMSAAIKISDGLIAELNSADHIIIGTPMYNFSIPAVLKAYVDHIVRHGVTFTVPYEGLVVGKKATVIVSSATDFSHGARYESYNVAGSYLRQILGFIGIKDVDVILASGALAIDLGEKTLDEFVSQFDDDLLRAVSSAA